MSEPVCYGEWEWDGESQRGLVAGGRPMPASEVRVEGEQDRLLLHASLPMENRCHLFLTVEPDGLADVSLWLDLAAVAKATARARKIEGTR